MLTGGTLSRAHTVTGSLPAYARGFQAKAVQDSLKTCKAFKLYGSNPRMVPSGVNPVRVDKVMAIPEYHLSQVRPVHASIP